MYVLLIQQSDAVKNTVENALTTSSSSSAAVVPVTTEATSCTGSDILVPTSNTADNDIHIVVDKEVPTKGSGRSNDSSIHIVVDDKTSSSRVVRTMVSSL